MMTDPASTPRREDRTRAHAEPIKVYQMDFDFDASSIVESWVLSPNSARNTRKKAHHIDFHIKTLQSKLL